MTDSAPHVLAVIDGYRLTGPARQLLALAERCSSARITLAVFQRSEAPTPFVVAARRSDVPMVVVRDRFPGDPRTAVALARLLTRCRADILQTHGYKANVFGRLVTASVRHPWVAFLHGETWENWKVSVYFALERLAVRAADRIVVVSHDMAGRLAARGLPASRMRVVHNACLAETTDGAEPAAWRPDALPIIGVVGRLSSEKGVDLALRVQQRVVRRCATARLWVIGEGPDHAKLRRMAERLEIQASVEWLGYREDAASLYRRMALLLIPSRSEGLPNVALEAMARGVPVVASAVGGLPEVVADEQSGLLAPREDVEGLAHRVVMLLEDAPLRERLGRRARRQVREDFSLEARAEALARVYEEVGAAPRRVA